MDTITVQEATIIQDRSNRMGNRTILFAICFLSSALGGTVSTLMSVYLPVAVRELSGNQSPDELNKIAAWINAIFIFGWTIGGFAWGIIGDNTGRKKSLLFAIACYGLFTVLTAAMPNWLGVVICRFMSGFGVGGVLVTSFTLLSEVWPPRSKAVFIGILSIAFPIGIFSAGFINYMVQLWRQGFLVGLLPLGIAFCGIWLINESGNWQQSLHSNTKQSNTLHTLFSPVHKRNLVTGSIVFGTMLVGLWAIFSWLPTWIQSLIVGTDAQKERGLSMMLLGMGGLTGGFVSGWVANALGLRRAMILCFAVCAVLSFVLFKTNHAFSPLIYAEITILAFFFGISQGVLSSYIPQLFPVIIRATATGFCFNIGRLFTALAVLFVGVLVSALGGYGNALFIFSLVFVVGWFTMLVVKPHERPV